MIPSVIHCCWFGGEKTDLAKKCLASWRRQAGTWTIREWNEDSVGRELSDVTGYKFCRDALAARRWAMASDWLRMAVLWRFGGVYLDFDVELVRGLDDLCERGPWIATEVTASGKTWLNPGSGCCLSAGSSIAAYMLQAYEEVSFDVGRDMMPFINENLKQILERGDECVSILAPDLFSPIDQCGRCHRTTQTRGIHHYAMSWASPQRKIAKWLNWHGLHVVVKGLLAVKRAVARG